MQPPPSRITGPAIARPTELRVESARLSFAYPEGARDVVSFEARYTVVNPGSAREDLAVAFSEYRAEGMVVTVDGAAPAPATGEEASAIKAALGPPPPVRSSYSTPADSMVAFHLVAEPGSRHEIRLVGRARGGERMFDEGFALEAVVARHLLLGTRPTEIVGYRFANNLTPGAGWKGDPRVQVSVAYPASWPRPIAGAGWQPRRDGSTTVLTRTMSTKEAADLELEVDAPTSSFRNGGVLLGIGGTAVGTTGVRGRIGYEVAAPSWMLYSLTADTDFRRRVIVTPMAEAATPALLFIPSIGLGVGVPVQIVPDARPGVRIQGDLHFYPVGLVVSGDIYPRVGALPGTAEVSVLAQVGL